MRRFDKKHNMSKVNLLAEQRYLESKGLISEGKYFADVLDKGTKIKFDGKDAEIIGHEFNPGQEAIYTIQYGDGSTGTVIANDERIEKINEYFEISENENLKRDDKIMWIGDDYKHSDGTVLAKKGDIGKYLGNDGRYFVSFSKIFYTSEKSNFKKI